MSSTTHITGSALPHCTVAAGVNADSATAPGNASHVLSSGSARVSVPARCMLCTTPCRSKLVQEWLTVLLLKQLSPGVAMQAGAHQNNGTRRAAGRYRALGAWRVSEKH